MRKILSILLTGLLMLAVACKDSSSEIDEICAAECLGKIRTQAQSCGDDQACKQQALADLKACEASCKK